MREVSNEINKWEVVAKFTTRKQMERSLGKRSGLFEIHDFQEEEIAIVRKNNKLGHESYGWEGREKIVLFADLNPPPDSKEIKWMLKIAKVICNALNRENL